MLSRTGMSRVGPVPGPGSCVWYISGTVTNSFPRTEYSAQIRNEVRPRNRADDAEPSAPRLTRAANPLAHGRRSSLVLQAGGSSLVSPSVRPHPCRPHPYWRWCRTTDLTGGGRVGGTAPPSSLRASLPFSTVGASLLAGRWQRTAATLLPGARRRCCLQIRTGRNHFLLGIV